MGRTLFAVVVTALFGLLASPAHIARAGPEIPGGSATWHTLKFYEAIALRDYFDHRLNDAIKERGNALWDLSQSGAFSRYPKSCGAAAQTLSYMVNGYYQSRKRLEIPIDWHYYAKQYIRLRYRCIDDTGLERANYPLPRWFGR